MKIVLVITFAFLVVGCLAQGWVKMKNSDEDCPACPVRPEERNPPCPYAQDNVPPAAPGHVVVRPDILGLVQLKARFIKDKVRKYKKLKAQQRGQSGLICQ
uniref:Uncharacterized protein n=1 Tax=Lygus hesperus TaxID=30085 RepID=A0A0A9X224_LYGHE